MIDDRLEGRSGKVGGPSAVAIGPPLQSHGQPHHMASGWWCDTIVGSSTDPVELPFDIFDNGPTVMALALVDLWHSGTGRDSSDRSLAAQSQIGQLDGQ